MNRHAVRRTVLALAVAVPSLVAVRAIVHAQIPQTFENLRVLPKDIPRQALISQMREIASSLGVRCNHCHPRGNPETLQGVDFASDSLETKRVAREMMRMTQAINTTYLPRTGRDSTRMARVTCITCHHGARKPETIADTLLRALDRGGAPATIAVYRDLREKYYGRAVYDFGEPSLWWTAEQAGRRTNSQDPPIALLELNLEFFPKSVTTRVALGDRLIARGDTAAAIARWEEALALEPGNRFVQGKLDAARGTR